MPHLDGSKGCIHTVSKSGVSNQTPFLKRSKFDNRPCFIFQRYNGHDSLRIMKRVPLTLEQMEQLEQELAREQEEDNLEPFYFDSHNREV